MNSHLGAPQSTSLEYRTSCCLLLVSPAHQQNSHSFGFQIENELALFLIFNRVTCRVSRVTRRVRDCFLQTKQFQPKLTVLYLARDARCICITFDGWPWFAWPTQIRTQMFPVVMRARAALGRRDGMNLRWGESAASQACRRGGRHRRPRRRRRSPATAPTHGRRSTRVPATQLCAPAPTATPGPSTALLPATSDWSGPRCDEAPSTVGASIL